MTLLWIALACVLLPALWLLVLPLRTARRWRDEQMAFEQHDSAAEQNVAIFRRRLAALENAHADGKVDAAQLAEERLELERSLLDDTATLQRRPLKPYVSGRWIVPLVMLALGAGSVVWYQQQGAEDDLVLWAIGQEVREHPEGSREMYIERLEAQTSRQPTNPNLWSTLFPLYRETGQADNAVTALERLIALEGRLPSLLAQLAQLRFFMAGRELTDEVQGLVDEVLAEDPRQPTALGILGIHAFDAGDYAQAIDRWRRAVANVENPDIAASLREGIQVAQSRLGEEGRQVAQADGPGVRVSVSLDPDLASQVDGDDKVFIVARDVDGEQPPLAVVQGLVSELPMTVVLDDRAAMTADAQISQAREVRLMVRVSPSGQATPQAGDLWGSVDRVDVGPINARETTRVTIDRVFE
ncbi:c-type cytochrome biogenesis protein CcmI [Halomonas janggokensis]|uniref:C-type cytochrome biogenesis protein CcmI n=1 Tax=Vreelandella janggokensis TaxID=370767 RepID=A0ABT4IQW4_9GAMM|nr:c-type cytochrome biogenesis protein CcmI [Halomonas janggokensis]MCZ0926049.1 c-type cytochrome biogenesis protein CcmI [Halomonas janggokensis]MCZ0931116.1 c-type cytochrome biogenesis protein CcmI [Halomonas janggokensis]